MQMLTANTPFGSFRYASTDDIGQRIATGTFWDDHLRDAIDRVPAGKVVIDVGANLGFFSVYLGRKGVKVEAFEPCPGVYEMLVENVELNGLQEMVRTHRTALYDRDIQLHKNTECGWTYTELNNGELDFDHILNSGQLCLKPGTGGVYSMDGKALDSYGFEDVALIKVDAQGCDLRVLMGARETIKKWQPILCFEFERVPSIVHGDSRASYEEFIADIGYKIETAFNPDPNRHDDYADYVAVPA